MSDDEESNLVDAKPLPEGSIVDESNLVNAKPNQVNDRTDSLDLIASAESAARRLEKANKVAEELLIRKEKQSVRDTLGGSAVAGVPVVEESAEDYAKRVMANDVE